MLQDLSLQSFNKAVYRLANTIRRRRAFADLGLTGLDLFETLALAGFNSEQDASELLRAPFRIPLTHRPKTRFSNGSRQVFYCSLDWETCEAEKGHYIQSGITAPEPNLYQRLECQLTGHVFDVRPKVSDWPFLVGDNSSYPKCQAVADEAVDRRADALITPSARRTQGANAPVFAPGALNSPKIVGDALILVETDGLRVEHLG